MRRTLLGILAIFLLCGPAAYAKNKDVVEPLPLFMDPNFDFSQVETICLAPIAVPMPHRTPRGVKENEKAAHLEQEVQRVMTWSFKELGYETIDCKPVEASLSDLTKPTEEWLRRLDFGSTKWLFLPAIEEISVKGDGFEGGHGVVSGSLFVKQGDSAKLVWRDRATTFKWYTPISHLIWKFTPRSNKHHLLFSVAEEKFDAGCDVVWRALNGAFLEDEKKYRLAYADESDMMVLYTVRRRLKDVDNEDHIVLKQRDGACVMQYTQAYTINEHRRTDDLGDLAKKVHALTAK